MYAFRHEESESVVRFEIGCRINGVFAHAQKQRSQKTAENAMKMQLEDLISHVYTFFGTRNLNLRSILKPEVVLLVLLRMRSNKITKNGDNCP